MTDGMRLGVLLVLAGLKARAPVRASARRDVVSLQFSIQGRAANAKHFPCERLIAVSLLEDPQDRHLLHFSECGGREGTGVLRSHFTRGRLFRADGDLAGL